MRQVGGNRAAFGFERLGESVVEPLTVVVVDERHRHVLDPLGQQQLGQLHALERIGGHGTEDQIVVVQIRHRRRRGSRRHHHHPTGNRRIVGRRDRRTGTQRPHDRGHLLAVHQTVGRVGGRRRIRTGRIAGGHDHILAIQQAALFVDFGHCQFGAIEDRRCQTFDTPGKAAEKPYLDVRLRDTGTCRGSGNGECEYCLLHRCYHSLLDCERRYWKLKDNVHSAGTPAKRQAIVTVRVFAFRRAAWHPG